MPRAVILFISDRLVSDPRSHHEPHAGGAELTDQAAVAACPHAPVLRRWRELTTGEIARSELIVVSNAVSATREQLDAVARTRRHVLFEHDLRLCRWRGDFCRARDPLHRFAMQCRCSHTPWHALFDGALGVIFLTERQRAAYHAHPAFRPSLRERVLGGSLFTDEVIERCHVLAKRDTARSHAAYAWSPNSIKGHRVARDYCRRMGWPVREVRRLPYPEVLSAMAASERFVYLPIGLEPAGRMPVEARLCGCEVIVNAQVGVAGEPLWRMQADAALAWLADGPRRFWRLVEDLAGPRTAAALTTAARPTWPRALRELATVRRHGDLADHWLSAGVADRARAVSVAPPWRTPPTSC